MDDFINRLNSPDEAERLYATQDIADAGRTDLAPVLVKRLELEESQAVREAIVCSLKAMPCPDIYQCLFELFSSLDAYLRNAAVAAFGAQGDEAVAFLSSRFAHEDREVRKLILDALFQLGTPEAVVAIRRGLRDSAVNVRITAVEYLGRLEDRDTVDEMLALFREEREPMLRTSILEALSVVGNGAATNEALRILAPDGNFSRVDPLYLPEVITLAARTGDVEVICAVVDAVTDLRTYADNIIRAIGQAKRRFKDIICEDRIFEKAMAIA
ncbi:MAG: HEAT repeat domain-containing protein, partial [Candidatus Latescibacterota bacterium]